MRIFKINSYGNCKILNNNFNAKNNKYLNSYSINYISKAPIFTGKIQKTPDIGKNIKNLGLIIKRIDVFNAQTKLTEKALLLFKNSKTGGSFRLLKDDFEKINKLSQEYKKYPPTNQEIEHAGLFGRTIVDVIKFKKK